MGGSLGPFSKGTYGTFRDLLGGHGSFGSFSKGTEKNMKRYYMVNFDGFWPKKGRNHNFFEIFIALTREFKIAFNNKINIVVHNCSDDSRWLVSEYTAVIIGVLFNRQKINPIEHERF